MPSRLARNGFTLVEILVVVLILGILAALVVPSFANASDEAKQGVFIQELKAYADAAVLYRTREGEFLEDASSGTMPEGFEDYIRAEDWLNGTSIGGVWDTEQDSYGYTSAIGVHFQDAATARDDDYMLVIDTTFDDGDLDDGVFRKIDDDRYYYIVEW